MLAKCAHGVREVNEISSARDDDFHVWMRTFRGKPARAGGGSDDESFKRAGIENSEVAQIESRCAGDENILFVFVSEFFAEGRIARSSMA